MAVHSWLGTLRRYLVFSAVAHLAWEAAHLPLYTLWATGTPDEIAFAVLHCTGGDLLIATSTLLLALMVAGTDRWPADKAGFRRVAWLAVLFAVLYTVFSEWLNVDVRRSWRYSALMPVLPPLGTGVSPLAQWVAVPLIGLYCARGTSRINAGARRGV